MHVSGFYCIYNYNNVRVCVEFMWYFVSLFVWPREQYVYLYKHTRYAVHALVLMHLYTHSNFL